MISLNTFKYTASLKSANDLACDHKTRWCIVADSQRSQRGQRSIIKIGGVSVDIVSDRQSIDDDSFENASFVLLR